MNSNLRLGVRAHDFGRFSAQELAERVSQAGFSSVHLALHKAIEGFASEPGHISSGAAGEVHTALASTGLTIGVLGCYINPVHPDPAIRERELARFLEQLTYACDFGALVVGTETGSLDPDCGYHEGTRLASTYRDFCRMLEKMLIKAEDQKIIVGLEPVARDHTIGSPELMARLITEMASPWLSVIYDPVNAFPAEGRFSEQDEITKCLDLFGDRICAFHLKDYTLESGNKLGDMPCGTGVFDYSTLFSLIRPLAADLPLLVENGSPTTYSGIWEHLLQAWKMVVS